MNHEIQDKNWVRFLVLPLLSEKTSQSRCNYITLGFKVTASNWGDLTNYANALSYARRRRRQLSR